MEELPLPGNGSKMVEQFRLLKEVKQIKEEVGEAGAGAGAGVLEAVAQTSLDTAGVLEAVAQTSLDTKIHPKLANQLTLVVVQLTLVVVQAG